MSARIVVLASGAGSNFEAIASACARGEINATVSALVCNRPSAGAIERARRFGVFSEVVEPAGGEQREVYDARLASVVAQFEPDWVVLAGWMRILTLAFLGRFPNRVVNLHPAMPGQLPGIDAIERAYAESQAGQRTATGVMVHLVPDEDVDAGPVLALVEVPIDPHDSLADLAERVHLAEHQLLISTLAELCAPSPASQVRQSRKEAS